MRKRAMGFVELASAMLVLGACPTARVVDCLTDADCARDETCDAHAGTCSDDTIDIGSDAGESSDAGSGSDAGSDGGTCAGTGVCPYQSACAPCLSNASAACLPVCIDERSALTTCSSSSSCSSIMDLACTQQNCPTQVSGYNTCMNANCCEWKRCF